MSPSDRDRSLGDDATFARPVTRHSPADESLGDERTLRDGLSGHDMIIDDIEVVDLESRYKVERTLGEGGMGSVLLATDTRLGRKVAIKRILGAVAENRVAVQRFLTEAKSIAALNHPNIVQIYDYGRAHDGPFLIMEYVDGGSLLDRCRDSALPLEEAITLACHVCDGLARAHDQGIIHRDIKPANILLTKDGVPKLTDFGLAKAEAADHQMTMTGAVMGTPDFMPPEQRRSAGEVDARSDLWSLSATVYQAVTGRSPRVIRLHELPQKLQPILAKALEDEKESRYQTARELRDALRSSMLAAAATMTDVVEGICSACGAHNDTSRKFCRTCASSLEAMCLSCAKPMPLWEEICGSCGARQTSLIETKRAEMAAAQSKAESLLGDFAFDGAASIAAVLRDESHPRLGHLKEWATTFLGQVDQSRSNQTARALESLQEASKHEREHDRLSAIYVLDLVPEPLRCVTLPESGESVAATLARLKKAQAESQRLIALIRGRIATQSLDGLLPDVERLVELNPQSKTALKLRSRLLERQRNQAAARDRAFAKARQLLAEHRYEEVVATLSGVSAALETAEIKHLRRKAEVLAGKVNELATRIRDSVSATRLDGLLNLVDAYLTLKPSDEEIATLRQSLVDRAERIAAAVAASTARATALERSCRFEEAIRVLEGIPNERRDDDVRLSIMRCQDYAAQRTSAAAALQAAAPGAYAEAVAVADRYRQRLALFGLSDADFSRKLEEVEAALAKEHERRCLLRLYGGIAGALTVAAVIMVVGLWVRSTLQMMSLDSALRDGRWEEALTIDPRSVAALVGRSQSRLAAKPPDIEGAFADIDAAERIAPGTAGAKASRSAAYMMRAVARATHDNLGGAESDIAEAVRLGVDSTFLVAARSAIAEGWIKRAAFAIGNQDFGELNQAVDAAIAAGAHVEQVNPIRARALVLQASTAIDRGDDPRAVDLGLKALQIDAVATGQALQAPESMQLAAAVLRTYRARYEAAVTADDWKEAARIAGDAAGFSRPANQWLRDSLSVARLERLAAERRLDDIHSTVFAGLPQATLAALKPTTIGMLPPLQNSVGMHLRLLPAGTFTMGRERYQGYDPHHVTLTNPFFIGVHEVTNAQWRSVMGSVPGNSDADGLPVTGVSWKDAVEFCRSLSELPAEKLAGRAYRLPTEAEWEYACRAGSAGDYAIDHVFMFGDSKSLLGEFAWFKANSGDTVHPVGGKKPNAWGLYDMHGNVQEWCSDWRADYSSAAGVDPTGPPSGRERVLRGGSYSFDAESCMTGTRNSNAETDKYSNVGFRCVLLRHGRGDPVAREIRRPFDEEPPNGTTSTETRGGMRDSSGSPPPSSIRNSIGIELKLIPAGTFLMGETAADDTHQVTLTKSFYLGIYEVTNAQWKRVMGSVPSRTRDDDHPVEQVGWGDAVEFCRRLSALPNETKAGRTYRLPTEAEWEYACRAGTTTEYSFGDDASRLEDHAWFADNSGTERVDSQALWDLKKWAEYSRRLRDNDCGTQPVGRKKPNPWGLHDMHGNVMEWCSDWFDDLVSGAVTDPRGPSRGIARVHRGGSWHYPAWYCRSADRHGDDSSVPLDDHGFRLAMSVTSVDSLNGITSEASPTAVSTSVVPPGARPQLTGTRVVNSIGMTLTVIPAGEFMMGTDPAEAVRRSPDKAKEELKAAIDAGAFEEQRHRVRITRSFLLGIHEVTQRQYRAVMGTNPSHFVGDELPVEHVTWSQAVAFCTALTNRREERAAGRRYRLPTEAEWEFACRAGTSTRFHVGDQLTEKDAKFHVTYDQFPQPTAAVGSYPPNAWGLHDMHGNVWEWTADWYDEKYFYTAIQAGGKDAGIDDPKGPVTGTHHVLKGGSASILDLECYSAIRGEAEKDEPAVGGKRFQHIGDFGIRVACECDDGP